MQLFSLANPVASIAVLVCWLGFGVVMTRSRLASGEKSAARRDFSSIFGIALQGLGIALSWAGPFRFAKPITQAEWLGAILPAVMALCSVSLFAWSTQTMGRNWSLVARTREDHSLVQTGPFALVRNPIYVALLGMMCALAIALGHTLNLVVAVPLYLVGTMMRISIEERLLRETFGQAFDDYARRVKRLVPLIW